MLTNCQWLVLLGKTFIKKGDAERSLTHLLLSTEGDRFWAPVLAAFGFGVMNCKVRVGKMTTEPLLGFVTPSIQELF